MKIDPNYPTLRESNIGGLELIKRGKVRDVYRFDEGRLFFVTTDRISTHDVVYKDCIPHKGFGLTQTTIYAFNNTEDIVENHFSNLLIPMLWWCWRQNSIRLRS
ncbi:MAG: hypothetical protein KAU24_03530 [Candidatus Aenigmarchaeota archaeon]|nr:hypothetical protein [Candidatus Aenigmarchaeota archaeon]